MRGGNTCPADCRMVRRHQNFRKVHALRNSNILSSQYGISADAGAGDTNTKKGRRKALEMMLKGILRQPLDMYCLYFKSDEIFAG